MTHTRLAAGPLRGPTNSEVRISVKGVSRKFCRDLNRSLWYTALDAARNLFAWRPAGRVLRPGEFWALDNISFEVERGQSVGVMGLNGAGKSTLLKLVLGSLRLSQGEIATSGRLAVLSEHGLGFDPRLSGRENIYLTAAILGISPSHVEKVLDRIVTFAELEEFIDSPVRGYSSGMRARLGFSVAMYLEPDILLVDEVLAVGDIGFQRRCIQHVQRYLEGGGSLLLVSHNPHLVQFICDRCLVLDQGSLVFDGDVVEGVKRYLEAAHTPLDDPLAFDPALLVGTPHLPRPSTDGGLCITDFGIQPVGSESIYTGGPARVYVRCRFLRDVEIRWGFCLLTCDSQTVITCEGLMEPFRVRAGVGELAASVPRLPLAGGRYALRVAIIDPQTSLPLALGGFHTPPRYFTVEVPSSIRNNYRLLMRDLVVLEDLRWERCEIGTTDA